MSLSTVSLAGNNLNDLLFMRSSFVQVEERKNFFLESMCDSIIFRHLVCSLILPSLRSIDMVQKIIKPLQSF